MKINKPHSIIRTAKVMLIAAALTFSSAGIGQAQSMNYKAQAIVYGPKTFEVTGSYVTKILSPCRQVGTRRYTCDRKIANVITVFCSRASVVRVNGFTRQCTPRF